jgi:hypothetical protein
MRTPSNAVKEETAGSPPTTIQCNDLDNGDGRTSIPGGTFVTPGFDNNSVMNYCARTTDNDRFVTMLSRGDVFGVRAAGYDRNPSGHGFMMVIDSNPNLALRATGTTNGSGIVLDSGCKVSTPVCTWSFRDSMLVSDANPQLAISAGSGADQTTLVLSSACTTPVVNGTSEVSPACWWQMPTIVWPRSDVGSKLVECQCLRPQPGTGISGVDVPAARQSIRNHRRPFFWSCSGQCTNVVDTARLQRDGRRHLPGIEQRLGHRGRVDFWRSPAGHSGLLDRERLQ